VPEPWLTRVVPTGDGPRTHALVIGVSAYDHLTNAEAAPDLPSEQTFGLGQLRSAAASAWSFARWLQESYHLSAAPLASIRLLLSPSPEEEAQYPELAERGANAPRPTRTNVADALSDWKTDCSQRPDDVAILYAAGHGVVLSKDEGAYVLLQDFGAPDRPRIENSLDVPSVRRGLAGPNVARRQFYFVDACAVRPDLARQMQALRPGVGLDEPAEAPPLLTSAIYSSAAPGTLALGAPGKGTLFSQALAECLGGMATSLDDDGRWVVKDTSLVGPLRERVMELAAEYDAEQTPTSGGTLGGVILHELPAPPDVEVSLSVAPDDAAPFCFATLDNAANVTVLASSPLDPPLVATVPAGLYKVAVVIDPPDSGDPPYKESTAIIALNPPKPRPLVVSVS
jgi:hypothetical protein